jgi:hypothetical protein
MTKEEEKKQENIIYIVKETIYVIKFNLSRKFFLSVRLSTIASILKVLTNDETSMCRDSQYNRDMFSLVFQASGLEERTLFFTLSRKTKSVRREQQKKNKGADYKLEEKE